MDNSGVWNAVETNTKFQDTIVASRHIEKITNTNLSHIQISVKQTTPLQNSWFSRDYGYNCSELHSEKCKSKRTRKY